MTFSLENSSQWTYEVGDLVWAKMKGFPPWPGKVTSPDNLKTIKKNCRWIFFFGSENFAWIETGLLKPYHEFKDALCYSCKTQNFKEACKAIERHIEEFGAYNHAPDTSNGISVSDADKKFDDLVHNVTKPTTTPKKKITAGRPSMPNVTGKSVKRKSSTNQNTKVKTKKDRHSSINTDILTNVGLVNNHSPQRKNNTLLDRPEVTLPESIPLENIGEVTSTIINRNIVPSELKFGFIGLGKIGSGIVKNLLNSGHTVNIWNRTPEKVEKFIEAGAIGQITPSDVMAYSQIIFCCVTDPVVAKDMVFGNCGVLGEVSKDKAYVEMSGIDADTSHEISENILKKGGRYMETTIQGSKSEAEEGNLVCLSAGDKSIYDECQSVFEAISKKSYFLGELGLACKYSMMLHTIQAVSLAGLAEALALCDRAGLCQKTMLEILSLSKTSSPLLMEKGKAMMENYFTTNHALKLIQKDVSMMIQWSECMEQPCPVSATVNEVFKHSKRLGYSDHDISSVYVRAKF